MREHMDEPVAPDRKPPDSQIEKFGESSIQPVKPICELFCFDWIAGSHMRLEPVPVR